MSSMRLQTLPLLGFFLLALLHLSHGQVLAPSTAPLPTSDGTAIDQGIAYFLLLIALAITYIFH
ncbi:hypothetical protein GIB67_006636 [Kingdonia uniflora]|uniref:Uncharacterized protein n=1 Tax=Kingdonia uniflora TaxID=39325 RepID=A0A7J7LEE5_9MAGN|nr:hypothetical protein GIB67_006636 [Kingdonia uniflora]